MADDLTIELDSRNLDKLTKMLKSKMSKIHVGILSNNTGRSDSTANNAQIGAFHEFGTSKLPVRSFLRVPLTEELPKKLESSQAFSKDVLKEVISQGKVDPWLQKISIMAESVVAEAFDSSGFGKWPSWKNSNYKNNAGMILVDTAQLRNSISSEIK